MLSSNLTTNCQRAVKVKNNEILDASCEQGFRLDKKILVRRISVVYNMPQDYESDLDQQKKIHDEIVRNLGWSCGNAMEMEMEIYVKNIRITGDSDQYDDNFLLFEKEIPLGSINVKYFDGDAPFLSGRGVSLAAFPAYKQSLPLQRKQELELRRQERIAYNAQFRKQNDINKQANLIKKKENHRLKAASVLTFVKKGSPETSNFSGYSNSSDLANIYNGNFELYTGGFETESEYKAKLAGSAGRMIAGDFGGLSDAVTAAFQTQPYRNYLEMAYYTYHLAYKEQCISNNEMQWVKGTSTFKRGEFQQLTGNELIAREPFYDRLSAIYGRFVVMEQNVNPSINQDLLRDFNKFLKTEGCASPLTRQFEINLFLASSWLLPIQSLLTPEERKETPKPASTIGVKKQTPSITKPKPKPKTKPKN